MIECAGAPVRHNGALVRTYGAPPRSSLSLVTILEGVVFNRILLCYAGSADGRRALKRGAEFAILVGGEVHVLSILASNAISPALMAAASGCDSLVDEEQRCRELLHDSIARWKQSGIQGYAYL